MTLPYGRNTHEVEKRIRHEALNQTARNACGTPAMQHIQVSQSSLIRALRLMDSVNPEVRTSGYVGIDDFAKLKGHKYRPMGHFAWWNRSKPSVNTRDFDESKF